MVRLSNNLVGILNFITFLLSIPILAGGVWLSRQGTSECERFLDRPVIALGVFLMIVSLAGLIGACCRVSWLLWVYLLVMFLLILLLFCFTVFAFVVTNKGAGEALSDRGYKEYRLGDYSGWLQKRVNSDKNWNKIRSCLQDSKVCKSLIDDGSNNTPVEVFYTRHLSAIQLDHIMEALGYENRRKIKYYLKNPSMEVGNGLEAINCDEDLQNLCEHVNGGHKLIEVYTEDQTLKRWNQIAAEMKRPT